MAEEQVTTAPEAEVVVVREEPQQPPEPPKSYWKEKGFLDDLARICDTFERVDEGHHLPDEMRKAIEKVANATKVEDFDDLNEADLQRLIGMFQRDLPQVTHKINETLLRLSGARSVVAEVDFI